MAIQSDSSLKPDREFVDPEQLKTRKNKSTIATHFQATTGDGECSTSSQHVESSGGEADPRVPFENNYLAFTSDLLLSLLIEVTAVSPNLLIFAYVLHLFPVLWKVLEALPIAKPNCAGDTRAIDARVEVVSRCLITIYSECSRGIGEGHDCFAKYLFRVIIYGSEKLKTKFADGPATPQLLCFFVFRCAKIFVKLGRKWEAWQACRIALQIIAGRSDLENLSLAIKVLQIRIDGSKEPDWEKVNLEFSRNQDRSTETVLLLTGFIRESGNSCNPQLDLKMVQEALTGALKLEEEMRQRKEGTTLHDESNNDPAKQATIRLTLAIWHHRNESSSSQRACLTLLKQAIAEFKQVECRCAPDYMSTDYYYELTGATECPRHQLLADALLYQGIVQSQMGLSKEARTSFEEGLSLVERHCKYEEYRKFFFRYNLSMLNLDVKSPHHLGSHCTGSSKSSLNNQGEFAQEFEPFSSLHLPDDIGESSASSESGKELCRAASEMPSEVVDGFTTRSLLKVCCDATAQTPPRPLAVYGAIKIFPELSDILGTQASAKSCCTHHARIELTTRCFMKVIIEAAKKSGKDKNIEKYIDQVVEDMIKLHKEFPSRANSELQFFLIFRCAKILLQHGRDRKLAWRVCESAFNAFSSPPDMNDLLFGIGFVLAEILDEKPLKDLDWKEFIQFVPFIEAALTEGDYPHCASAMITGLLTGYLRESKHSGDPILDLEMVKGVLNEALKREGKTNDDAAKQATIRLTLAQHYLKEDSTESHQVCMALLEQAVAGFREVKCRCPRYGHMRADYYDELFGATECPRHVLLGDALSYQGNLQRENGFMEEAEKSFEEGLSLAKLCNDEGRMIDFNIRLSNLKHSMMPTNPIYGLNGVLLARFNAPGYDAGLDINGTTEDQYLWKFVEDKGILGKNKLHQLMEESEGDIDATQLKELLSSKAWVQEYVQVGAPSGDNLGLARVHGQLCLLSAFCCPTSGKEHLHLAVEALDRFSKSSQSSMSNWEHRQNYIEQSMLLGQSAMLLMELDHAHKLWYKVYQLTQKKLEDLAQISSEDQIFRYFETSKHVCVALATCESLRANQLEDISGRDKELLLANFRSLMWAERGKGAMLSMFFKTGRVRYAMWDSKLDPKLDPKVNPIAESHFMRDDDFALWLLHSRSPRNPFQTKKTLFVEYTIINQRSLLIHLMAEGGYTLCHRLDLSKIIDIETQREAERELTEAEKELKAQKSSSLIHSEVGSQSSTSKPMTESNLSEGPGGGGVPNKVVQALYNSGVNRAPFNRWIPGMVAGIQRRAEIAQKKRVIRRDFKQEEVEIRCLLQKLYAILIKPIKDILDKFFCDSNPEGDCDTLVFIPHEDLGLVPFGALYEKGSSYLIEQYAISVSPAIWCSRRLEMLYYHLKVSPPPRMNADAGPPVLVGRKDGYPDAFGSLVQAHEEVAAVAQALNSRTGFKMLIDDDTDPGLRTRMKERVMDILPNASWIHLSVHGEISSKYPQGSLLLGDNDNQRLSAAEIIDSGLRSSTWRARCAVASACQSGLGSVAGGGIMGFARALMLAEVPSCVLSMWEVDQMFCTSFMGNLYTELGSGKNIGHAIQSTIKSMMHESVERPARIRVRKPSRFGKREPPKPVTPEREPKWSILDWAAFSCFGFPGVKLPGLDDTQPDAPGWEVQIKGGRRVFSQSYNRANY
ncbi:hypothetical protein KC19_11G119400 [Ceratodon purpureus]|uniref:CHAT domain-containing protein n=1 Tax=Ceratodon purpureus TaxID=3225 RepID=A0A8T0GE61_CERPU|nr:hypothetical protein KC19_11G119400 [Ceratodon purpureus]